MLCQKCKKSQATVHLTEIQNNEKREKHLCELCAAQEGITDKAQQPINQLVEKFVLAQKMGKELSQVSCPDCGINFLQFRNGGLLGCPHDYQIFKEPLMNILEKAHEGRIQHVGKIPGGRENKHKRQHELMKIKRDLQEAIDVEDYERAAVLRDKIKKLEQ